jgi:hypothetical protein
VHIGKTIDLELKTRLYLKLLLSSSPALSISGEDASEARFDIVGWYSVGVWSSVGATLVVIAVVI